MCVSDPAAPSLVHRWVNSVISHTDGDGDVVCWLCSESGRSMLLSCVRVSTATIDSRRAGVGGDLQRGFLCYFRSLKRVFWSSCGNDCDLRRAE